jgi:hypothetical protein
MDRITHIIHLVPDRHPYLNPRYRTESPIYSVQDRITHIITHIMLHVQGVPVPYERNII